MLDTTLTAPQRGVAFSPDEHAEAAKWAEQFSRNGNPVNLATDVPEWPEVFEVFGPAEISDALPLNTEDTQEAHWWLHREADGVLLTDLRPGRWDGQRFATVAEAFAAIDAEMNSSTH